MKLKRRTPQQMAQQRVQMRRVRMLINFHFRSGLNHNCIVRALHNEEEDGPWGAWRLRYMRGMRELAEMERELQKEKESWQANVLTQPLGSST